VYLLGAAAGAVGIPKLFTLVNAEGAGAPNSIVTFGGVGLVILWCSLMFWSFSKAGVAARQREVDRANVSAGWQRNIARPPEIDLKKFALGRVPPGGDMQGLSFLGPAEDAEYAPEGELGYDSQGICLKMKDGRLTEFLIDVNFFLKTPGAAIHTGGMGTKLHADVSEPELVALLGAPYWREPLDAGGATLYFERFDGERWLELQLDFDETGRLSDITATDTPTLADAGTRRQLGVTEAWPPQSAARRAS
jgi:hypothetical protein